MLYHQDPGRILDSGRAKPASHPLTVTLSATATVGGGPPSPEALLHHSQRESCSSTLQYAVRTKYSRVVWTMVRYGCNKVDGILPRGRTRAPITGRQSHGVQPKAPLLGLGSQESYIPPRSLTSAIETECAASSDQQRLQLQLVVKAGSPVSFTLADAILLSDRLLPSGFCPASLLVLS
ncbi:hypothetical protein CPAR01_07563 [Colletotrichum paranaense]|uniref:Uncharacterized protein n=1 Tax=Colletotrichum paranaense TaxID=1914294 RepID=A0ABQ9SPY3_9PEZI|nr:uncharacterized protein CPAR01_07563 [Colletotrichum paranaense]KAK1541574.1 hypothetical protein CPAR01_07563 [Colletotrichum paranaense]